MAETRSRKFCTKGDYIKSYQTDEKSPLKGCGFACVTHFYMHNCGVRNNSPHHSVSCNQQCHHRQTTAYRTYGAPGHSSIGSICQCICCKVDCTTDRQQID